MYAVCRRITGNDADAADAAQEAMLAVVRGLGRFDGRAAFGTWVYRIATNASLDELRRRRRRPQLAGRETTESARPEPADDAHLRVEHLGDRLAIDVALADLPDEFRIPVVLRDVGDLDYAEIAQVLDVPIGTVKSRIARGRAQVAAALSPSSGNRTPASDRPTHDQTP